MKILTHLYLYLATTILYDLVFTRLGKEMILTKLTFVVRLYMELNHHYLVHILVNDQSNAFMD